jgi:acyl-CoA hydrolase
MGITTLYKSKLTTPADAVGRIASGVTLSMGMAMSEPPALLKALADRAATGQADDLKIYYLNLRLSPARRFCATNWATAFIPPAPI